MILWRKCVIHAKYNRHQLYYKTLCANEDISVMRLRTRLNIEQYMCKDGTLDKDMS